MTASLDNEWLPKSCPDWCTTNHYEVFVECDDWEAAQEHQRCGPEYVFPVLRHPFMPQIIRDGGLHWHLCIRQRQDERGGMIELPTVDLEIHHFDGGPALTAHMTSGEARILARQLTVMADKIDLEDA